MRLDLKDRANGAQRSEYTSGMTVADWCAEHQISKNTYYYRLKQLRKYALEAVEDPKGETTSAGGFVKLPTAKDVPVSDVALRIRCRETTIEVSNDASERILALVKEVEDSGVL